MIAIVMGVSGSGKTVIGQAVAARLGWAFLDADTFHPPANVAKMARGEPLTDADRQPWLAALNVALREAADAGRDVVLACSALKRVYRRRLVAGLDATAVRFVYLKADFATIERRMRARTAHFMPPSLLASQFEALEEPGDGEAVVIDARQPEDVVVGEVVRGLT